MPHLKALKLTTANPARANADPIQRLREKVIASLADQKAMAEAKMKGEHYAPTQTVWRKNEAGERVQVEKPRRIRQGWFTGADGVTYFALRYAGKPIEFAKGKNAIEADPFAKLPEIIDQLIAAVRAGELDEQLSAAAEERSKQLCKTRAA